MAVIGQAEILLTANTASFTTEMDRARSVSQRTARQIERDQLNKLSHVYKLSVNMRLNIDASKWH